MERPGRILCVRLLIAIGLLTSSRQAAADQAEDQRRARDAAAVEARLRLEQAQIQAAHEARRQALEGLMLRQRETYQQMVKLLPQLAEHEMGRIMRLRVEDARLVLHTSLAPMPTNLPRAARIPVAVPQGLRRAAESSYRADVDGLDTPAIVNYTQFGDDPNARQFEFTQETFPDGGSSTRIHLLWRPGAAGKEEISIERSRQDARSFLRVIFSQGAKEARLIAIASFPDHAESCTVAEKDFVTLRTKHPQETREYLRPTFAMLLQSAAFSPDTNAAWQVLEDIWPPRSDIDDAVRRILPDLNSPVPRVRSRASRELMGLGRDGATAIVHLSRENLSFEQNARLDAVLAQFEPWPHDEVIRSRKDAEFLLDCQYCDDAMVRRLALARLEKLIGHPVAIDPNAAEEDREQTVESERLRLRASTTRPAASR